MFVHRSALYSSPSLEQPQLRVGEVVEYEINYDPKTSRFFGGRVVGEKTQSFKKNEALKKCFKKKGK